MKKLFIAILGAVAVAACSHDVTLETPKGAVIGFDNVFVENATRAADLNANNITDFGVYGFISNAAGKGQIFNNQLVAKSGDAFTYSPAQYWVANADYYFAAVAPAAKAEGYAAVAETPDAGVLSFNNETAAANTDLLFAYYKRDAVAEIKEAPAPVAFTFDHVLSRVKFSFKNGFAEGQNIELKVTNVNVKNAIANGTLALEAGVLAEQWADQTGAFNVAFGNAGATLAANAVGTTEHFYLIPANAYEYNVTFDVTIYQAGVKLDTYKRSAKVTVDLLRGNSYELAATLNASNVSDDGENALYPIEFAINKVNEWVENVPVDEVIDTDEELAAVLSNDSFPYSQINVKLGADLTYNVGAREVGAMGSVGTEVITIDLNGHTLTFNQTNSDWNNINTNGAKLVIKNGNITNAGHNNGPWNRHDLNFVCPVELVNVVSDKAIALAKDATLTKVTINDANTSDTYAVWVRPMGQTVVLDECTIDMLNCSDGRGLKIDNQYLSAAEEAKVTLKVSNTVFKTEEKSAILVKTTKGADITLNNVNIADVAADNVCPVWIDEAVKDYADLVTVTGGNVVIEGQKLAVVASNDEFAAAVAAGCDVISLADGTYNLPTSLNGMNLYITGASKENTIIDMSNGATPQYHAESVSFKNLTLKRKAHDYGGLSHTGAEYIDNCIIEGTLVTYAPVVVVKNSSFVPAATEFYNLHIYSAGTSTFENCTFRTTSCRSVYAYAESAKEMNISFKDCTFATDTQLDTTSSKYHQAIRLHTELGIYGTLSIENCSTDGKFNPAYNNGLWVEWNNSTKVLTDNFVKTIK